MPRSARLVDARDGWARFDSRRNIGGSARVAAMVNSIIYTQTGDASVLALRDRPAAEPGSGEVLVRVMISAVNPTDWKRRAGPGPGRPLEFAEIVPNQDGAGVVEAVGHDVSGLAVGDRVWLYLAQANRPTGTAQEYVVLPAARVVPLPDGASFEVGASLGVPAMTAYRALTVSEDWPDRLYPGALDGATVLVAGGAGAVGHAAIQLARWSGATVITTVSGPEKGALATAAGAHHVVNYKNGDAAAIIRDITPGGVDMVVEVAPAQNAALNAAVASPRASIAVYANDGGSEVILDLIPQMMANLRYQFILLYTVGDKALANGRDDVSVAAGSGALAVGEAAGLPLHRFQLAETGAAHDAVQGGVVGKVLIDVASDSSGR